MNILKYAVAIGLAALTLPALSGESGTGKLPLPLFFEGDGGRLEITEVPVWFQNTHVAGHWVIGNLSDPYRIPKGDEARLEDINAISRRGITVKLESYKERDEVQRVIVDLTKCEGDTSSDHTVEVVHSALECVRRIFNDEAAGYKVPYTWEVVVKDQPANRRLWLPYEKTWHAYPPPETAPADSGTLQRGDIHDSPGAFAHRLRAFRPAREEGYLAGLFAVPRSDEPKGTTASATIVKPEQLDVVEVLFIRDRNAVVFASGPAKETQRTAGALFLLLQGKNEEDVWQISDIHPMRFDGENAAVTCELLPNAKSPYQILVKEGVVHSRVRSLISIGRTEFGLEYGLAPQR